MVRLMLQREALRERPKNDTADAEAICEAITRPNMRFVPTRTGKQQSCLFLHRARHLFIRQLPSSIQSAHILPSSGSLLLPAAAVLSNC